MSRLVPQGKHAMNPPGPGTGRAPVARSCQCPQVDSFEAGVPPARGTDRPSPTIAGVIRVDRVALRGLKARGHPVGASGAYQVVEAVLQLRGEAGANQVKGARRALAQSIGGHGSVAVTHVLEA